MKPIEILNGYLYKVSTHININTCKSFKMKLIIKHPIPTHTLYLTKGYKTKDIKYAGMVARNRM